jgi:NarL family two-component system response regulator LiaR
MSVKIILVDDHQLVRESLRVLLEKELGMEVIAEAGDGETAVQLAREHVPDIIIMDVAMPGLDGINATKRIISEFPSMKVIALSMYSNKLFVMDMFEAGASGYLLKGCASRELEEAIRAVLRNEIYLSPKVAGIVLDSCTRRPITAQDLTAVLTDRECEVLRLLASGKSTKEIAQILKKSVQTIDMQRRQIMHKLDIHSVAELTKFAIREGLTAIDF